MQIFKNTENAITMEILKEYTNKRKERFLRKEYFEILSGFTDFDGINL